MTYLTAFVLAIGGVAAIYFGLLIARFRLISHKEYEEYSKDFFTAASKLIDEEDSPEEMIELISSMNAAISDKRVARKLFAYPMHLKWSDEMAGYNKIKTEFLERRPELRAIYEDMFCGWFLAVTALSPFAGTAARYSIAKGSVGRAVATVSKRSGQHYDHKDNGGASEHTIHAH